MNWLVVFVVLAGTVGLVRFLWRSDDDDAPDGTTIDTVTLVIVPRK